MEQGQRVRVLVVDDDPVVLEVLSDLLSEEGYQVSTADDWSEVAEILFVERPEVVLLDVMLPGVSGDSIAQIIRETVRPRPRILLHSSMPEDELEALAARSEATGYLHKGCPSEVLLQTIQMAVRKVRGEGSLPPPRPPGKDPRGNLGTDAAGGGTVPVASGEVLLAGPAGTERVMVQAALVGAGFEVHLASTWEEVMEEVLRQRIRVLVLDDRLPRIAPIAYRRAVRKLEEPPALLLWSSRAPFEGGGLERELRATGVVFQGVSPELLVDQVRGMLRG